jgi:hypothetical protein
MIQGDHRFEVAGPEMRVLKFDYMETKRSSLECCIRQEYGR